MFTCILEANIASKQRLTNVDVTSWRHIGFDTTLFSGCVPAGCDCQFSKLERAKKNSKKHETPTHNGNNN